MTASTSSVLDETSREATEVGQVMATWRRAIAAQARYRPEQKTQLATILTEQTRRCQIVISFKG